MNIDIQALFEAKVPDAERNECWLWQGPIRQDGYGSARVIGKEFYAHRLAWSFANDEEPTEMILHTCDNKACVNPNHLYQGNASDNAHDMYASLSDEEKPGAVLTQQEADEIRMLYETENPSLRMLGRTFDVSHQTIKRVVERDSYVTK